MSTMGASVTNGALSTLVGISALVFAKSAIFVVFFKVGNNSVKPIMYRLAFSFNFLVFGCPLMFRWCSWRSFWVSSTVWCSCPVAWPFWQEFVVGGGGFYNDRAIAILILLNSYFRSSFRQANQSKFNSNSLEHGTCFYYYEAVGALKFGIASQFFIPSLDLCLEGETNSTLKKLKQATDFTGHEGDETLLRQFILGGGGWEINSIVL